MGGDIFWQIRQVVLAWRSLLAGEAGSTGIPLEGFSASLGPGGRGGWAQKGKVGRAQSLSQGAPRAFPAALLRPTTLRTTLGPRVIQTSMDTSSWECEAELSAPTTLLPLKGGKDRAGDGGGGTRSLNERRGKETDVKTDGERQKVGLGEKD